MTMAAGASRSLVLVVDDQEAGRFAKSQIVRRARFDVVEAATGHDALSIAANRDPDLVILDVNLPDISGLEVCRQLKARHRSVPMQVVQVSATAITDQDRIKGLDGGADAYLTEPVNPEVLVATLNALDRTHRAEAALARANRLKDDFIAVLSHELRSPLNVSLGWIARLRRDDATPEQRARAIDAIERATAQQWRIVNDLLDVARIENGKLEVELGPIDLVDVVRASVDAVGSRSGAPIAVTLPAAPIAIVGDAARLQQVIVNLLTNARNFTPEYGSIAVAVAADDDFAEIVVEDTGAGIEPELLPHLFEHFRQSADPARRRHKGLGLGLSIARGIVHAHHGTLRASSPGPGQGATFTIRLPLRTGR
ncbi:MAG TPA: ATP-binding protein [Vicinamibacterales bacterium]|nr:ATP-binding protein [Vicinamibacterales bacterium]